MSSFHEILQLAKNDPYDVPVFHRTTPQESSTLIGEYPKSLLCLFSGYLRCTNIGTQTKSFVLTGCTASAIRQMLKWMRDCATAGQIIELQVFIDGGEFYDMVEAAKMLDMVSLKKSLDQRLKMFEAGYLSLTDVCLAYKTPEPRDLQLEVAVTIGGALRDKLIPNKFPYLRLRREIPQFDKDINEWFANEKTKAMEMRDQTNKSKKEQTWEEIKKDARNGLRTLPI